MSKPIIVQFEDGTYGIRFRFCFFWFEYLDLTVTNEIHKWGKNDKFFKDCKGDLATVEKLIAPYYHVKQKNSDNGKPIKYDYENNPYLTK